MSGVDISVILLAVITIIGIAGNLAQILEWWEMWQERHARASGSGAAADSVIAHSGTAHSHRRQKRLQHLIGEGVARAFSLGYTAEEIEKACSQSVAHSQHTASPPQQRR